MKKSLVIASGAVILLVALWIVLRSIGRPEGGSERPDRPPVAVEVDSVRFGPIAEMRALSGTIAPRSRYVISPKVAGRLVQIRKRIGDPVSVGEVVARLENEEFLQSLKEAEANVAVAQANLLEAQSSLELARQDLARARSLQEKGIASSAELDAAQSQFQAREAGLKLAQAQVESRQSVLDLARIRLGYTELTASAAGFIGERFVDEGSLLAVNSQVLSVVTFDRVFVKATIVERDYARISPGTSADIEVDAYPGHRFQGVVTRIAPLIEQNSRQAELELEAANDSLLLKPGMFARISLALNRREGAQLVPSRALLQQDGRWGVFIVAPEETVATFIPVTTGIVTPEAAEVLEPELNGLVVTLGQHLLSDGSRVILPEPSDRTALQGREGGRRGQAGAGR